jgi:hydroxymethylbilane synthase
MTPTPDRPLRIGTRASPLALAQAHEVRSRLAAAHDLPEAAFLIMPMSTVGDRVQDRALSELGGKGLFTRDIEDALLDGGIDIAVHSMKDMPVLQPAGLVLDCFLPREDVRDAVIGAASVAAIPEGWVIGTSSLRRRAQLLRRRPDLRVVEFRGNVQTRLRKLSEGVASATFLALAGLRRLKAEVPANPLDPSEMLPAVAQGVIGVERRVDDRRAADLVAAIHDTPTGLRVAAERAFLARLDGSCQTPIAGLAELDGGSLRLRGEILRPDGSDHATDDQRAAAEDGPAVGEAMARRLLEQVGPGFLVR